MKESEEPIIDENVLPWYFDEALALEFDEVLKYVETQKQRVLENENGKETT